MQTLGRKCLIALRPQKTPHIKGYLIGQAPVPNSPLSTRLTIAKELPDIIYTVDALVQLVEFDKGKVYQIPFSQLEIVDKWEDEK